MIQKTDHVSFFSRQKCHMYVCVYRYLTEFEVCNVRPVSNKINQISKLVMKRKRILDLDPAEHPGRLRRYEYEHRLTMVLEVDIYVF